MKQQSYLFFVLDVGLEEAHSLPVIDYKHNKDDVQRV